MHGLFRILRATNHEQRATAFFRTHVWLRRDILMSVLRPCAICHKFRLCTGLHAGRLGQASPTQSQTGDKNLCGDKPHSKAPYGAFFYEPRVTRGERRTAACDRRAVRPLYDYHSLLIMKITACVKKTSFCDKSALSAKLHRIMQI